MIDEYVEDMLEAFGAVCIEGPKWCGKTWMSLNHANSFTMVGEPSVKESLKMSYNPALKGDTPHLIDEWQEIPYLWDAVRMEVDREQNNGRFILTGSSTPIEKGMHSGAGRIGKIRMRTMSLYEMGESDGSVSLKTLFDLADINTVPTEVTLNHLIDLTVRGGWPRNIDLDIHKAMLSVRGYYETLRDDAAKLEGEYRDIRKIDRTFKALARNESTLASMKKISEDTKENDEGVSDRTISTYLDVLDRMFVINDQPAFNPNLRSSVRVGKSPKRHLADPALVVAAMNYTPEMLLNDLNTYGFLFEAMCERDLDIYAQIHGGKLYHYRDSGNREIDAVVEMPDGKWGAFEIKLGFYQIENAAKKLIAIREYMSTRGAREPTFLCVICGLSTHAFKRSDGVYVVPITSLKP